jgi:septum site-determining protein MinC
MSSGTAAVTEIDDRRGPPSQIAPHSALHSASHSDERPAAILKGGPRGLEIIVDGGATVDAIAAALTRRLEEAPGFFRGSDVRVRIDGALPAGCLGRLEEIATRFELAIVEVGPRKPRSVEASAPVPQLALAAGTAPAVSVPEPPAALVSAPEPAPAPEPLTPVLPEIAAATPAEPAATPAEPAATPAEPAATPAEPAATPAELAATPVEPAVTPALPALVPPEIAAVVTPAAPVALAIAAIVAPVAPAAPERTRMVVGPVRSGVILDHPGHIVVVGDVNPGAEVRAEGNIVILGRLRGIAHAGIGRERGFILALRLEPQQLRIGRLAARAPDASSSGTEIAYVTDRNIVVERYAGKLPAGLAAGI